MTSAEEALRRPVGWWLKEADAAIERATDRALSELDADRRRWQLLSTLSNGPIAAEELMEALRSFSSRGEVEGLLADLTGRGWVRRDDGFLALTSEGERVVGELTGRVALVRARVAEALPPEDYTTLVTLLARLVDAVGGRQAG